MARAAELTEDPATSARFQASSRMEQLGRLRHDR